MKVVEVEKMLASDRTPRELYGSPGGARAGRRRQRPASCVWRLKEVAARRSKAQMKELPKQCVSRAKVYTGKETDVWCTSPSWKKVG